MKRIILLILLIVLSSSIVHAENKTHIIYNASIFLLKGNGANVTIDGSFNAFIGTNISDDDGTGPAIDPDTGFISSFGSYNFTANNNMAVQFSQWGDFADVYNVSFGGWIKLAELPTIATARLFNWEDPTNGDGCHMRFVEGAGLICQCETGGVGTRATATWNNQMDTDTWMHAMCSFNQTSTSNWATLFINGTQVAQAGPVSASGFTDVGGIYSNMTFGRYQHGADQSVHGHMQDWFMTNRSFGGDFADWLYAEGVAGRGIEAESGSSDETAPIILSYNLTSEGGLGCTNWNASKTNACETGDTLPTVEITTDEDAFCAIGVSNSNFTNLGVSRNCTGGGGTTSLTCTLTSQDQLVYEDSFLYIGCRDSRNNENASSTSGALSVTVTGLEAASDTALGVGVQNALLSGYTNHTSQQIYGRNLEGTQVTGTFDWVAKKDDTLWAFNFVSKGETHVGLFNLTPSLYVLELSNISSSSITTSVEALINATK